MSLQILKSGVASIQGLGSFGMAHQGIRAGGAMDMIALAWANHCLGNDSDAAGLEIMGGGFSVRFMQRTRFALCGAWGDFYLDQTPLPYWGSYQAEAGQVLSLSAPKSGWWTYLAIAGGLDARQSIQAGAELTHARDPGGPIQRVPRRWVPSYTAPLVCRYLPRDDQTALDGTRWAVSPNISRMGYRLSGRPLRIEQPRYSAPMALGAIQIPPDGQPIVLMRDHQVLGGYPVIGHVARPSLGALAQRRPGQTIVFQPITIQQAKAQWSRHCDHFGPLA